jgi:hypothetical protein
MGVAKHLTKIQESHGLMNIVDVLINNHGNDIFPTTFNLIFHRQQTKNRKVCLTATVSFLYMESTFHT